MRRVSTRVQAVEVIYREELRPVMIRGRSDGPSVWIKSCANHTIYGGTSEIMKTISAREVTGLRI